MIYMILQNHLAQFGKDIFNDCHVDKKLFLYTAAIKKIYWVPFSVYL